MTNNIILLAKPTVLFEYININYLSFCIEILNSLYFILSLVIFTVFGVSSLILFSKGKQVFDNVHKILTGGAGAAVLYNNLIRGSGGNNNSDDNKDKDKDNKNKESKDTTSNETTSNETTSEDSTSASNVNNANVSSGNG